MGFRAALGMLVVVTTLMRLAWAAALGPGPDEAYHALFLRHLDWSYLDHPPMTALIEAAGLPLAGGPHALLGLRIGFIALMGGSTLLMARLATRAYGPAAGFLAAFVLNATAYYGFAAGSFVLPDGPLLFFWLLTLDRLAAAIEDPDRLRIWAEVGLAWGGALLSKYHAIFLPAGALLYLLTTPGGRRLLGRPGPYLAAVLGTLAFTPVLAWNAAHGWASFAFQGSRALGSARFRPDALAGAIAGQALYLLPWLWAFLVLSLGRGLLRWRRGTAGPWDRFFLCQSAPPLAAFLAVACVHPVLPHWSLIGLVPVIPLLAADWSAQWENRRPRLVRRLTVLGTATVVIAALVALQVRTGLFQCGGGGLGLIPPLADPTADLFGWDQAARELERRGVTRAPVAFLFTGRWYHSGHLAYALGNRVPVLCYNRRHAQNFAYWSRPEDWTGRDGLYVGVNDCAEELSDFQRYFTRVDPLGSIEIRRGGQVVRVLHLYSCVNQTQPFPFGNRARGHAIRRPGPSLSAAGPAR